MRPSASSPPPQLATIISGMRTAAPRIDHAIDPRMPQPGCPATGTVAAVRTVQATRYVIPLREGGSMPGLVEADDDGLYVLKFRGAGQGAKALLAEIVAGELARAAGLPVPEIVFVELDPELGRAEPDPEIQELIAASGGLNVGLDFLPGSLTYNPAAGAAPDPELAAEIVWLDALVTNVDRSPQNPNLLLWHGRLWLIDHGAALYLQHAWADPPAEAQRPFPRDPQPRAAAVRGEHRGGRRAARAAAGTRGRSTAMLAAVPDDWFAPRVARRVPRVPVPPAGGAARVRGRGGGGAQCRLARSSTRSSASCRRSSAASASTPASCCSAAPLRFLAARVELDEARLRALAPDADVDAVRGHLDALVRDRRRRPEAGPIAALPASERFHWLVAPSSTMIQCSPVHTGLSDDPERELEHLVERLVR